MFGLGKKRIHIGQFCKLVQLKIYEKRPLDMDFMDNHNVLSDQEHKILNADLFTFRFVAFHLLLVKSAISKKSKRTPYDLGYISSHSLKLTLQDKGHNQEEQDEFEGIYTKQIDYQMKLFSKVDISSPDKDKFESAVSIGFTKYFGDLFGFATPSKENGELEIKKS
jgi:asparagine synthetase A